LNILDRFSKNIQISNFVKISPVEAELFRADRRTDMKLTVAFLNFTNAPKNQTHSTMPRIQRCQTHLGWLVT